MWHIRGDLHRGDLHNGAHGRQRAKGPAKRRCGFSHPARFEILEERLPFDAASGLPPVPASAVADSANGVNPANPVVATVSGTAAAPTTFLPVVANDALAFNNPSWVPEDRPPFQITASPNDALPANVNQVAGTPVGIRNFEIGANTSVAHGNSSRIGLGGPTARSPVNTGTRMTEWIEHSLDQGLLAAKAPTATAKVHEATEQAIASSPDDHDQLSRQADRKKLADSSAVRLAAFADEGPLQPAGTELDFLSEENLSAGKDTLADPVQGEFDTAGLAVADVASERSDADGESASSDLHALAASFAVAAVVRKIPR
ncbi:MAG: hypothetical protein ACREHD_03790 [Pirellulales bacterium]